MIFSEYKNIILYIFYLTLENKLVIAVSFTAKGNANIRHFFYNLKKTEPQSQVIDCELQKITDKTQHNSLIISIQTLDLDPFHFLLPNQACWMH